MTAPHDDLQGVTDASLVAAIAAQKETIAAFEAEFIPMRQRYERLRQELRRLEGEVTRRRRAAEGQEQAGPAPRRGGTLVGDVVSGRVGLDPLRPLAGFLYFSLGRQQIYLNRDGRADEAVISLYRQEDRVQRLARTFAEVESLRAAGLVLGVPGVPLERQGVYYVAEARPGWLRLDQIFVEDPTPPV